MASPSIVKPDRVHPRAAFRVALIALALVILLPLHLIVRLFTHWSSPGRWFLAFSGWAAGARVVVKGEPIKRHVLYIANHVSWLDILILSGHTGCAFVAKADMAPWPVLGWLATLNNSVYVQRENRLDAHGQATQIRAALESRQPLTLFPEGTTANGLELLPFRSSLVAAVVPAPDGISIQPVAINYGPLAQEVAWTEAESVGVNALRVMARAGNFPVTLHFLKPLDHEDFNDRKAIAAHSRAEIAAALFGDAD